ncbi:alpha/beta hydrolase family protein [Nonomuraea soli]|uniref:Prolyl oligopeptidase family serine peptidase n=1 Tax=Nonomuraea soli TaxID=1032476 RepID=A0A7W0CD14_9ACTN|nr:hypothetical protein [Nonomuraea soli]MBA2888915.1 hypothetical protein [Nonomuraea soli]
MAGRQFGLFPEPGTELGPEAGPELAKAAREAIGVLDLAAADVRTERAWSADGLACEEVSWDVGFGPRTHAYVLRPADAGDAVLPGVVALHCHAGMKWAGKEKIADPPYGPSPEVVRLREAIYGGLAWAGELARRGFTVLAHDVFTWGSRRFPLGDAQGDAYDEAAGLHEQVVAKHCTVLGTSYAGVVAGEDLAAAAYLRSRPDTGPVGCAGLSGGGMRAVMLGAFDAEVAAVASVAMISSYRDLLDEGYLARHTWMLYPPGLSRLCDLPDLAACAAPRPLLVWYGEHDEILPLTGMRRAHAMIERHYGHRHAPGGYTGIFGDAGHSFGRQAQERVFRWLARHLIMEEGTAWR